MKNIVNIKIKDLVNGTDNIQRLFDNIKPFSKEGDLIIDLENIVEKIYNKLYELHFEYLAPQYIKINDNKDRIEFLYEKTLKILNI